ncbi:DUF502 domain-containing protein [Microvirga sp. W0021]|uniref:DUF502 domain-containing protein n=1 Tax=Hohaiivirga grylli TaxID=3133970 RepID=A0ABV0BJC7_9HYPH
MRKILEQTPKKQKVSRLLRLRLHSYFLTGLIIAGPLAITAYISWWFVTWVDGWVKPFIPLRYLPETYLEFDIPGVGLIAVVIGLTVLGFLAANLLGKSLLGLGERILQRMPVVRGIYNGTKQVFETIFSADGTSFRTVGLVQFPTKGTWSIVFISTPATPEIQKLTPGEEEKIGVFLPCTPNPTTGFFFYLPKSEIIELQMSVDDAAKLVMSAGVIQPESLFGKEVSIEQADQKILEDQDQAVS